MLFVELAQISPPQYYWKYIRKVLYINRIFHSIGRNSSRHIFRFLKNGLSTSFVHWFHFSTSHNSSKSRMDSIEQKQLWLYHRTFYLYRWKPQFPEHLFRKFVLAFVVTVLLPFIKDTPQHLFLHPEIALFCGCYSSHISFSPPYSLQQIDVSKLRLFPVSSDSTY